MDSVNVSEPAGATDIHLPGVLGVYGELDGDMLMRLIVPLLRLAHELYGQADEVGERFCQEVTKLARGSVRLLLWDQQEERAALAASPAVRLKLPVEYRSTPYGEFFIASEPQRPTQPALSYENSAKLAEACGWLLHLLEEGALLNSLGQRLDLTSAERSLSRCQLDVLRHMAMGEDAQGIAEALHVTPATVAAHRRAIYTRLGVHNPVEAVLAGHRLGLICLIGNSAPSRRSSRGQHRQRKYEKQGQ